MTRHNHADLVVLGAGPGGYAAAFRAADLGREVVLIDPRPSLGGVCLNEGCIPSKALLHAAEVLREAEELRDWGINFATPKIDLKVLRARKNGIVGQLTGGLSLLAKKRKVRHLQATAAFTGAHSLKVGEDQDWTFDQAIIAVGSSPVRLPGWPEDARIMDSTGALELRDIPKRLCIVGGGIIGLEMAIVYAALGSKVSIVELAPQIVPEADARAVGILKEALEEQGCSIHTSTRVTAVRTSKSAVTLICEGDKSGKITADAVIQAVGRRANGHLVVPEAADVEVTAQGIIPVDQYCRSTQAHIFAVGDVTGNPMLAHRATHQAKVAAEVACGLPAAFDSDLVPAVAYTNPELAWVGLTAAKAKQDGIVHKVSSFPWAASGRNLASGGGKGTTQLVYCPDSHRILGATIVGRNAGELLAEIVLAMETGALLEDLALTIHAHPTLSETTAFVAELALGTCTDL